MIVVCHLVHLYLHLHRHMCMTDVPFIVHPSPPCSISLHLSPSLPYLLLSSLSFPTYPLLRSIPLPLPPLLLSFLSTLLLSNLFPPLPPPYLLASSFLPFSHFSPPPLSHTISAPPYEEQQVSDGDESSAGPGREESCESVS